MKIEITLDELCLVISALRNCNDVFKRKAAREQSGTYNSLAAAQHAERCENLSDRLHDELAAAEHAELVIDNME